MTALQFVQTFCHGLFIFLEGLIIIQWEENNTHLHNSCHKNIAKTKTLPAIRLIILTSWRNSFPISVISSKKRSQENIGQLLFRLIIVKHFAVLAHTSTDTSHYWFQFSSRIPDSSDKIKKVLKFMFKLFSPLWYCHGLATATFDIQIPSCTMKGWLKVLYELKVRHWNYIQMLQHVWRLLFFT